MTDSVHKQRRMDTVSQTVELPAKRQNRRHPLEWKRSVVEQTFEPGAAVARVARENNINANQVWAWRKLYAQGLLVEDAQMQTMLPVVVDVQSDRSTVQAPDAPASAVAAKGSIQLQHGNTSLRIEGVPDATILRLVLERILR
ncbi:IS66-like element accessory protein TnpA [Paraburkholderia tropica]|uniref:IS66-like element accessory protein TnpA n=2 Tax=Paraburkholderia tropica TaxID=92647 RepID=UPI002AAFC30F|nr:transposase [Paraburkholderia tropica]